MSTHDQSALDFLRANVARPPFHGWLQPQVVAVDEAAGTVTLHLPLRPEFSRSPSNDGVHGGIISALVDLVGHAAIAVKVRHSIATVDLRVDYLRLATGSELRCTGTAIKVGRTIGIADVRIEDDQGRAVAIGRAAFLTQRG
jgi:uncharacterized protein (TIGR00369 family)